MQRILFDQIKFCFNCLFLDFIGGKICCYTLTRFDDFQLCVFQYLVWFNACLQAVDILFIEYKIELVADQ